MKYASGAIYHSFILWEEMLRKLTIHAHFVSHREIAECQTQQQTTFECFISFRIGQNWCEGIIYMYCIYHYIYTFYIEFLEHKVQRISIKYILNVLFSALKTLSTLALVCRKKGGDGIGDFWKYVNFFSLLEHLYQCVMDRCHYSNLIKD